MQIQNNKFTFKDIEPNIDVGDNFYYSPQAKVGSVEHYTPNTGDNLDLTVITGGTANTYQWYKDDVIIIGEGELNSQTKFGKIPYKIAEIAKEYKKIVIGIFGSTTKDTIEEYKSAFTYMSTLCEKGISKEKAMQNAYLLLSGKVKIIFEELQLN